MRSDRAPAPPGDVPADGEQLAGLVERVSYHSDETGFTVLRVRVKGRREVATVVGSVPDVQAGEGIEARGAWSTDPRHGPQFKAETIRTTPPSTVEGIERYLASGTIPGIGPELAKRLVDKFGSDVFDIIDHQKKRLLDVEGIGRVRQQRIVAAWDEQKAVRAIMVFLHSHGVSSARAFRIHQKYGDEAIRKVTEDPYRLARDLRGVGFQTADKIAASLGVEPTSDLRARAGVEHVLQKLTEDGHCAFPREALIEQAVGLLEIPAAVVAEAVDHGLASERLAQHLGPDGEPLLYLSHLDRAEQELARDLVALARRDHPAPDIDVDKAISWFEERSGFPLAPAQRTALVAVLGAKVAVLTGGPGVGKTTLIDGVVRILAAKKLEVVLCAPTGRAAKRMSETTGRPASTIHRLLAFDPRTGGFLHGPMDPLAGDVFVVDETSMVDLPLAHSLVRALPRHAALVLVGDVDQLPSVGPGRVLADVIDSEAVVVCRLTEIFRQAAESAIVQSAHRILDGEMPEFPQGRAADPTASDCYLFPADEPTQAVATIVRLVTEAVPRRFGFASVDDIQVLTPMQRGELGARNLNAVLQHALNPEGPSLERFGWTFRQGDKVLQTVNDYDKDVFNGDIGRIARVDREERKLVVDFEGRRVEYDHRELDELILSYAITVHKSQGSEYPVVIVPLHTQHYPLLQRNLLYTALTRGRKLVIVVGSRRAIGIALGRTETRERITTLAARLRHEARSQT